MAVVLRAMQWMLDDAAFAAGRGDLDPDSGAHLADNLERTAANVRAYAGTGRLEIHNKPHAR